VPQLTNPYPILECWYQMSVQSLLNFQMAVGQLIALNCYSLASQNLMHTHGYVPLCLLKSKYDKMLTTQDGL